MLSRGWAGSLTRMRVSMTSLQICRLVALVTSKNRSLVVFLILKEVRFQKRRELSRADVSHATGILRRAEKQSGPEPRPDPPPRRPASTHSSRERRARALLVYLSAVCGSSLGDTPHSEAPSYLCLLTVRYWWERDHISVCVHETRVIFLPIQ